MKKYLLLARMQKIAVPIQCIVCMLFFVLLSCQKSQEYGYDIYENHNISACGVNDPLQNIEWLRKYCGSIKERIKEEKDIISGAIWLYKVIDKDEYIFRMDIYHHKTAVPLSAPINGSVKYLSCNGDTVYIVGEGETQKSSDPSVSHPPDPWFEDKEFFDYLFHFFPIVKQ